MLSGLLVWFTAQATMWVCPRRTSAKSCATIIQDAQGALETRSNDQGI